MALAGRRIARLHVHLHCAEPALSVSIMITSSHRGSLAGAASACPFCGIRLRPSADFNARKGYWLVARLVHSHTRGDTFCVNALM